MNKTVIALIALAVSFTAGFVAGGIYFDNRAMSKQIVGNQLDEKDVATNIDLRKQADNEQQNRLEIYHDAQQHDTIRTDALLDRVLNHFDRVQLSTGTTKTEVASTDNTNTCRVEKAKASELSRQLRETLERYGREAQRADENTRTLNLCISELEAKEKLLNSYR
ncbi:hypothetical protein [Proteus mirabilis]|uniref:hypothetical protein n=1 Tax=Proteus mirabilis TaxID=584 RepID=UPI001FADE0BA|nr:hypothetical protein [Proteus mirabilis]MCI9743651.1 hypothetical protein [Proteus mirabilis]MCI9801414.1 hypothetical protein [Proteus mirabilis]MCI9813120.1 hypothetical protein [Proteus mirabilis]